MTQQKPLFSTSHYVKGKHIESPAELRNTIRHSKVTKYAMRNTTMSCDRGRSGSQPSAQLGSALSRFLWQWAAFTGPECYLFFFLWCLRMPMLPVFMKWHHVFKKKTNILNMFTKNCLLYIHIMIYLFYSQCALHNQDIGFVAFCPCSHPNCCSLFVKTFTDVGL